MIELGKLQELEVARLASIGVFLKEADGSAEEAILLPKSQVPAEVAVGNKLMVFVYKDSEDRMIATMKTPLIRRGELQMLKVIDKNTVGAFLDWGLEKNLFLPFKQQTEKIFVGSEVLVSLYLDKSDRLCATMDVYDLLRDDAPYEVDAQVEGTVYAIKEAGAFVAVDNLYHGLVPSKEVHGDLSYGEVRSFRVTKVREDGRLDLSTRAKAHLQMDEDSTHILEILSRNNGFLALNDNSTPEDIAKTLKLSKKAFKRAIGKLYKDHKIEIVDDGIKLCD